MKFILIQLILALACPVLYSQQPRIQPPITELFIIGVWKIHSIATFSVLPEWPPTNYETMYFLPYETQYDAIYSFESNGAFSARVAGAQKETVGTWSISLKQSDISFIDVMLRDGNTMRLSIFIKDGTYFVIQNIPIVPSDGDKSKGFYSHRLCVLEK